MRRTKYQPLDDYLLACGKDDLMLTFTEIENILGFKLSPSARKHRANWSNNEIEALSWGWRLAGYESYAVDINREVAHFRKVREVERSRIVVRNSTRMTNFSYRIAPGEKVDLAKHVNKFTDIYNSDNNSRYFSYDHIRRAYLNLKDDESQRDLLTLNLYSYLASWGMLRNSFLMQKDYKFLTPIVDILCDEKYESLINYNPFIDEDNTKARLIMQLVKEMRSYFIDKTYFPEGSIQKRTTITSVSDTLVSKILLGTLGCTVAYDTYVRKGLAHHNLSQRICIKSILELRAFAKANEEQIKELLSNLNDLYTPMKIIDMYFFEEGFTL